MNVEDVIFQISQISAVGGYDPERAHGMEDLLLWEFVRNQADHGNILALEIMKLKELKFERWYA